MRVSTVLVLVLSKGIKGFRLGRLRFPQTVLLGNFLCSTFAKRPFFLSPPSRLVCHSTSVCFTGVLDFFFFNVLKLCSGVVSELTRVLRKNERLTTIRDSH